LFWFKLIYYIAGKIEEMEKDFKNRLKKAQWRRGGKSTTTTTTTGGGESGEGGEPSATGEGTDETDKGEGGGEDGGGKAAAAAEADFYDPDIVESRIHEINEKWKLQIEKLEKEKVGSKMPYFW
jgi:hypothetical protein